MSSSPDQLSEDARQAVQDARAFGMDDRQLGNLAETLRGQLTPDAEHIGIWPENAETVRAFLCVATQWRVVALGGGFAPSRMLVVGLDYAAARVALDAAMVAVTPELWRGLQTMEAEATAALNED